MPIVRMINKQNPDEIREFQERLSPIGRIRLGVYEKPEGRSGRPVKLSTFRFTSPREDPIRKLAELYKGEVRPWTPQGGKTPQWEVISQANNIAVYMVHGQLIDPCYEAWAGGRTCLRRCDGVRESIHDEPCVCNGPAATRPVERELCKPTIRINLMIADAPGLGSWLLESHGENAVREISVYAGMAAQVRMPVLATLLLRREVRRPWSKEKGKYLTEEFFVPTIYVDAATPRELAAGGNVLDAAGAPAALGGVPTHAIEAPVAPVEPVEPTPAAVPVLGDEERQRILVAIEKADLDGLEKIKNAMIARSIRDKAVQDSWVSRRAGLLAAAAAAKALGPVSDEILQAAVDALPKERQQALKGLLTDPERIAAQKEHQDRLRPHRQEEEPPAEDGELLEPDYQVGDVVTVGGIEFTKIADGPTGLAEAAGAAPNLDAEFMAFTMLAGARGWTTAVVGEKLMAFTNRPSVSEITATEMATARASLEKGDSIWGNI